MNGRTQSSGSGLEAGHVHVMVGEDVVCLFLQDRDKRGRVLLLQGVEQILLDWKPVLHVIDQEIHILCAASWMQQACGIIGEFGELPSVIKFEAYVLYYAAFKKHCPVVACERVIHGGENSVPSSVLSVVEGVTFGVHEENVDGAKTEGLAVQRPFDAFRIDEACDDLDGNVLVFLVKDLVDGQARHDDTGPRLRTAVQCAIQAERKKGMNENLIYLFESRVPPMFDESSVEYGRGRSTLLCAG